MQSAEPKPARTWGARLFWTDTLAILFCGLLTWLVWPHAPEIAILFPVVLGHFFLFCNVFRLHRKLELLWGLLFILNAAAWMVFADFSWLGVLAVQAPITLVLIVVEMRSARYHGIFAPSINPALARYLAGE